MQLRVAELVGRGIFVEAKAPTAREANQVTPAEMQERAAQALWEYGKEGEPGKPRESTETAEVTRRKSSEAATKGLMDHLGIKPKGPMQ